MRGISPKKFISWRNSPCDTAGLEQLRERGIREPLGVKDESSQCLLFMFVVPQFEFVDALLLLSVNKGRIFKINLCTISRRLVVTKFFISTLVWRNHKIKYWLRKNSHALLLSCNRVKKNTITITKMFFLSLSALGQNVQ